MSDQRAEADVKIMFITPDKYSGHLKMSEIPARINLQAPAKKLLAAILKEAPEMGFKESEAILLVQPQDDANLSQITVQDGSLLVIVPKS